MSFNVFRNGAWDLAQRLRVFRTTASGSPTTDWYLAKKISAWRGADPGGFWQTVYPDKPFNPVTPITTGTPVPEFTLSLDNYLIWDYSDYRTPDSPVTYQWQRSLTYDSGYSDISGATGTTYTVQSADIGYYIRCRVRGTNERDFTDVFSTPPLLPVADPYYTFNFGTSLGVNANAFIMLDTVNGVFPSATQFTLLLGRILRYFTGSFSHYTIWYKSDASTFRIYHQMYRDDQSFPASPSNEVEIVFTNGSNVVDIYVVNPVTTTYINTYTAWQTGGYSIKTHPSASYAAGRKFRVTMNSLTAVSVTTEAASTTSPSAATGWIQILSGIASTDATVTFTGGGTSSSPISAGVNGAFTKPNMFFPTTPTVTDPVYATSTTATVSWSGSNANGYYVTATRTDDSSNTVAYSSFFGSATTSTTMTGLVTGATYSVTVSPISRGAPSYDGQFGFAGTKSYTHVTVPSAVQNLTATSPTQVTPSDGESGGSITYTVSWSAPATGAPITRYEYDLDIDGGESTFSYGDIYTSNGTSTTLSIGPFSGLQLDIRVRAVNGAGAGPATSIRLNSSPSAPGTPSAGAVSSTNAQTTINWTASNARGGSDLAYTVYRGQNDTTITNIRNNTPQSLTSFSDNVYGSGTTYYYRVVPQNKLSANMTAIGVRSAVSNAVNVTQPTVNVLPVVSANSVSVLVIFSGNIGSGSTPNYSVFRGQNTNPQTSVGSVAGGSTNTNNTLLSVSDNGNFAFSTTYYYKVQMTNNINQVESIASVTTPSGAAPGRPGAPSGSANNQNNNVNLSWSASADNGGGTVTYTVFRGQNSTNVASQVGTTTNTQFTDSYTTNPGSGNFFYRVVPSTPWGGTGQQSNVSAGIPAS